MEIPKFVKLNDRALRLKGNEYYLDAGNWSVEYKIINGELLSWSPYIASNFLHKKPLIEITEEQWRIDNGDYAPKII